MARSSSRLRAVTLIAGVSLLVAACGSDDGAAAPDDAGVDGDTSVTTEAPTTEAPTTEAPTTQAPATTPAPEGQGDGLMVEAGDFVKVHYVGTLDDGEQFDSSRDRGATLDFTVGAGQMISGFDDAVRGMAVGELKTVRLAPADAYGERSEDLIIEIPSASLPEGTEVGQTLFTSSGQSVVVVSIDGDTARIDTNHRLAGEFLTFEIEIVAIER